MAKTSAEMMITKIAPAKLNLFLHIVGQRSDGYHLLESLFAFTQHGDEVTVQLDDGLSLTMEGPYASSLSKSDGDNLVVKAAKALQEYSGHDEGAHIALTKNLPVASGIGGGSADAAATLLALNELWKLNLPFEALSELALSLGADVPACLKGGALYVSSIGEIMRPANLEANFGVLLANPGQAVSTPEVFQTYHKVQNVFSAPLVQWGPAESAGLVDWLYRETSNDLQAPAETLCTGVSKMLMVLQGVEDVRMVRMSGSGATCFALFDNLDQARAAKDALTVEHPDWWLFADALTLG